MEPRISKILTTTAFRELSHQAAPYALMLARMHDAELHVLHVADDVQVVATPVLATPTLPAVSAQTRRAPEAVVKEAHSRVRDFAHELFGELGDRVKGVALQGDPAVEIVKYARENEINLIIMGTHGDGLLRRIVFGSVTKRVTENSPCPVLLIPVPGAPRI
ncbi:MAG: universal stress protein [Planctomycetes bacterium]|nr:universal stress protein [Planctomycetota bacterium]